MPTYFVPGKYNQNIDSEDRARTIAAFHIAQGNPQVLSNSDMRGDIVRELTSKTAVGYWQKIGWIEVVRKVGRIRILRLTSSGLMTCANSVAGGSSVPTTQRLVDEKRRQMLEGGAEFLEKVFPDLIE
jgi:hypothetical protein